MMTSRGESHAVPASGQQRWVWLLGRSDEPVDAVRDYCRLLAEAVAPQGIEAVPVEVSWNAHGWRAALQGASAAISGLRPTWVVLQYTPMAWSRRGFPLGALRAALTIRRGGYRLAVMFHDWTSYEGPRSIDRFRRWFQLGVMRLLFSLAQRAIFPVPPDCVCWIPQGTPRAAFIPVGANLPDALCSSPVGESNEAVPTVAVFCLASGPAGAREVAALIDVVRSAASGRRLRLSVFGRGAAEAQSTLQAAFAQSKVELDICPALLPAEEIVRRLQQAHAALFVRGQLEPQRSSALAAIACGTPLVAFGDPRRAFPTSTAGVLLARPGDAQGLAERLAEVLDNPGLRHQMREASRRAYEHYFCWKSIARRYLETLGAPLRVLIYSHFFLPSVGGVERIVNQLAQGLAAAGVGVTVVTQTPGSQQEQPTLYPVVRRPGLVRLIRLIRQHDIVHLAGPALAPLLIAQLLGRPPVIEHHGYQAICPNGLLLFRPRLAACPGHFLAGRHWQCWRCNADLGWSRSLKLWMLTFPRLWLARRASQNVAVTAHVARRLGLPRSLVIYHGVALPEIILPDTTPPAEPLCFAYVGRLVAEKGVSVLLDAAGRLRAEGRCLCLKIIGDGPLREFLEREAAERGLSASVEFTGMLHGSALEEALGQVQVLVMPSLVEETAGLAALEFMARGKPLIVADIGGLAEVVGDAGLKFPAGSAEALAACMCHLLDQPALYAELARRARARVLAHFTHQRMVEEHLRLYRRLAQSPGLTGSHPVVGIPD